MVSQNVSRFNGSSLNRWIPEAWSPPNVATDIAGQNAEFT